MQDKRNTAVVLRFFFSDLIFLTILFIDTGRWRSGAPFASGRQACPGFRGFDLSIILYSQDVTCNTADEKVLSEKVLYTPKTYTEDSSVPVSYLV